jgi:hypothetical protein
MRIQRPAGRSSLPYIGIGCAALILICVITTIIGAIFLLPRLPEITLQIAGFQPEGQTDAIFANVTPIPTIEVQNPTVPSEAIIDLGSYGTETLNPSRYDYTLTVGSGASGGQLAGLTFTETSLMALCAQRTTVCSGTGGVYRNGRIDLRSGGAVIYADVFVAQLGSWQNLGVVMRTDSTNRQIEVMGVDLNGTLYAAPPTELGSLVRDIAQTGNDILRQLALEANGERYNLSEIRIDDTTLTMIMR